MMELVAALEQRAKTSLLNPLELTPEILSAAASEAIEISEGKAIPQAMLLDIAIVRLKLYLKVEVSDFEQTCYNQAIKKSVNTALPTTDTDDTSAQTVTGIKSGQRVSEWDMGSSTLDERLYQWDI